MGRDSHSRRLTNVVLVVIEVVVSNHGDDPEHSLVTAEFGAVVFSKDNLPHGSSLGEAEGLAARKLFYIIVPSLLAGSSPTAYLP